MSVLRLGRGIKGRILGIILAVCGARILRSDLQKVLSRIGPATA